MRSRYSGNYAGGATPVPIPNTEVKPAQVDGTAFFGSGRVDRCRFYLKAPSFGLELFFVFSVLSFLFLFFVYQRGINSVDCKMIFCVSFS